MKDPFVRVTRPRLDASMKLFCIPFSGGGASAYGNWAAHFDSEIEVCAMQLPGREDLFNEPLVSDFDKMASIVCDAIERVADKPIAIFGHSLGALLGFAAARMLTQSAQVQLVGLFASACRAPHLPNRYPKLSGLGDRQFLTSVKEIFGGVPDEILSSDEYVRFFTPLIRSDLALGDSFAYRDDEPLFCPITAFYGQDDTAVRKDEAAQWVQHTREEFSIYGLRGDHFFLKSEQGYLLRVIQEQLAKWT